MPEIVLVTEKEYRKGEAVFRAADDLACEPVASDELAVTEAVTARRVRAAVVGIAPYQGPLYAALGAIGGAGGALLARFGAGHENIDKALAQQHGVLVANTPGVLDQSVAEHTLWLIGCLARHLAAAERRFRAGEFTGATGRELCGQTLGILGFGRIGRRVAAMAHFGFGMRVLAGGRRSAAEIETGEGRQLSEMIAACGVEQYATDLEALVRACEVLSVHLPVTSATRHFLNAERLAWLKPTALLVNTARGAIVDEAALFDALVAGRLAGAALDVFVVEPYCPVQPDKDLRRLDNVVLTPHIGSNTHEANARMAYACVENLRHFFAGRWERLSRVT